MGDQHQPVAEPRGQRQVVQHDDDAGAAARGIRSNSMTRS
jgi:hypothetical protein